jgi:hypothetical protein
MGKSSRPERTDYQIGGRPGWIPCFGSGTFSVVRLPIIAIAVGRRSAFFSKLG